MKKGYKNIILALELKKGDRHLVEKAQYMVAKTGAKLTLVHAIEHTGTYNATAYGLVSIARDIEEALSKYAAREMTKLGTILKVPQKNQIISFGPAKLVVLEEAEKRKADLIIIGSRGMEGIRLLIGSTANAVLHSAKCDVLAVRIK